MQSLPESPGCMPRLGFNCHGDWSIIAFARLRPLRGKTRCGMRRVWQLRVRAGPSSYQAWLECPTRRGLARANICLGRGRSRNLFHWLGKTACGSRPAVKYFIEFFSFATGRITPFAPLEKEPESEAPAFAMSSDSRWILYSQVDQSGSDIMLVENFR